MGCKAGDAVGPTLWGPRVSVLRCLRRLTVRLADYVRATRTGAETGRTGREFIAPELNWDQVCVT